MPSPLDAVTAAFVAAVTAEGLAPPADLRLLRRPPVAEATSVAGVVQGPSDLGPLHEQALAEDDRTAGGSWYTPMAVAEDLVARAAVSASTASILDPCCGGGVFLLAAADALATSGVAPEEAVGHLIGRDVAADAVAVTQAALWWWLARRVDADTAAAAVETLDLATADALAGPLPRAEVVVGNPPFLGQLRRRTTESTDRRTELKARFGSVVRAYTDPAWLVLLAAVEATPPGGRVVLIQPQSVLAARDAGAVRDAVDERADLGDLWIDPGDTFSAAVDACAPVLTMRPVEGSNGRNDWTGQLADRRGIPSVALDTGGRVLGDVATIVAGFRDEFYGLAAALHEGGPGPRVVTVGAIDPFVVRAGPRRIGGRSWDDPRVDVEALEGRARRWVEEQTGPTILVATQTKVLEAVADPDDDLVASVPAIVVRPHRTAGLWHLLAALHAPVISAWMLRATVGTGLSRDACRPTAALLTALPLPEPSESWDVAAAGARRLAAGGGDLAGFARAADAAYGIDDPALRLWWLSRLPVRSGAAPDHGGLT